MFASTQKVEGKTDLAEFVMNRGNGVVEECVSTGWEMEKASEVLERSQVTRIQILEKRLRRHCTTKCYSHWAECAQQPLTCMWSHVPVKVFTEAVKNLLATF